MSQPIDIVQKSLPEPELVVLEAVEQIERPPSVIEEIRKHAEAHKLKLEMLSSHKNDGAE